MSEPKGDCPFCDVPKWHVCDHFVCYVRDGKAVVEDGNNIDPQRQRTIPLPADTICVNTGVSVRAYRKGRAS